MQPDGVHCNTPPHLSSISVIESLFRQGKQVGDTVMNIWLYIAITTLINLNRFTLYQAKHGVKLRKNPELQ